MSLHRQLISYRYPARRGARSVKVGTSRRRLPSCVVPDCLQTACKMPPSLLADATYLFSSRHEPARAPNRIRSKSEPAPASRPAREMHSAGGGGSSSYFFLVFHEVRGGVVKSESLRRYRFKRKGVARAYKSTMVRTAPREYQNAASISSGKPLGPEGSFVGSGESRRGEFYLSSP
jgi:hypothetical protein